MLSFIFPLKVLAKNYDQIYIFGDSFSDTGNVYNTTSQIIPPSPPYFNGRFSNGPVWVEYLASDLGLTFNSDSNFAFGGATTGFENIGMSGLPGLQQEINSFIAVNPSADSDALYILWIGANDYLNSFFGGVPDTLQVVTNESAAVTSLAAVGAKDIVVANLPDLGMFPIARSDSEISNLLSADISIYNSDLAATLNFLSQKLSSDVNIIPLDLNSLFNRIISAPDEFGFTNVSGYCIQDFSVVSVVLATQPSTCDPNKFLFWDPVHPTTVIHKLIGEFAFSVVQPVSVPEASTAFGMLLFGALGVVSLLKRKYQQVSPEYRNLIGQDHTYGMPT
ncbi:SGNH/GDSL hydrolase family protein [Aetokthonos hydrillicola Thurmond2011]|uniref:SGNH/GDSL hydrolase family protein n=1 Tax=Aetokthonos hydrillicola Thurmond2011 TaxID=2712845 RepID=A0AAP5I2C1_9CYAN|nr:SGNH/GDSL hydrolase family protein [Aetokthonos hydrillicola Thurmond2011]